jgi:hypothetical protein
MYEREARLCRLDRVEMDDSEGQDDPIVMRTENSLMCVIKADEGVMAAAVIGVSSTSVRIPMRRACTAGPRHANC